MGDRTRPTSDRVREALFSQLDHETEVSGARVLDLYAGSGALGLEALSRGAGRVTLVESAPPVVKVIRANVAALAAGARVEVVARPVAAALETPPPSPYEIVLMDPPYDLDDAALAENLRALAAPGWLAPGAVVVVERSSRTGEPDWPGDLDRFDVRRHGETRLWWADTPSEAVPA